MNGTTSTAVARTRIADDRGRANETRRRHPATHAGLPSGRWTGGLGGLATVLAACALFASIPTMAGVPAATDGLPRPMPAPAPAAVTDFPEHPAAMPRAPRS
jgi:hypothetical protein